MPGKPTDEIYFLLYVGRRRQLVLYIEAFAGGGIGLGPEVAARFSDE